MKPSEPSRIERLRTHLVDECLDMILITNEINVQYLSGFSGDSSYLLVGHDSAVVLSDRRYETQIASECPELRMAIRPPNQPMPELLREVLSQDNGGRIGLEAEHTSLATAKTFSDAISQTSTKVQWEETRGLVENLRCIKDLTEQQNVIRAVKIAERAFLSVTSQLTPRTTEREVAHELESVMRRLGAEGVSFSPIVGAQPSGALPHYRPRDTPLGDTSTLLIDWGANYQGYASDLTRTLHQKTASQRFLDCYQAVLESQLAAIDSVRGGVSARDVDAAARTVLQGSGIGDAFK
ncbi:MAG: Xaa-Pro peptidase family protein, partial [Planctomycetota bacterium]